MRLYMVLACFVLQATDSVESFRGTHLNPQEFMTISEVIQFWGYPSEEYQVLTEDGYYLQVNRIPYGVSSPGKTGPRPAVLIVHGILSEGRHWIANIPSNSLGFFLADAGYDVWLLNCRGNSWSRRNRYLSINQEQFWNFSIHEMGIYDVPATINFILDKTQQDGIYYIGHSQGASIGFIAFSFMPQLGQKIKLFMCFAPAYIFKAGFGLVRFSVLVPDCIVWLIFGNKEFSYSSNKMKVFYAKLCSHVIIDELCLLRVPVYCTKNLNASRADVYVGIDPDYSSVKTIIHWKQIVRANKFQYYDYGCKNKAVYNMTTPPVYKIEDVIAPTAVWSGEKDTIANPKNVEQLLTRIKHLVFYKRVPYWGHQDFVWGLNAPELVYSDVLYLMNKYQ